MRYPECVDVWRQHNCDAAYSISVCDADGEIECVGGCDDADDAFAEACEAADGLGVPARLLSPGTEEVVREWSA